MTSEQIDKLEEAYKAACHAPNKIPTSKQILDYHILLHNFSPELIKIAKNEIKNQKV
jgi:hypothetical protein